jgi:hypothetical protein
MGRPKRHIQLARLILLFYVKIFELLVLDLDYRLLDLFWGVRGALDLPAGTLQGQRPR